MPAPQEIEAAEEHGGAPDEEAYVPIDPLLAGYGLVDVMETEKLMVDQPFNKVEKTKAHQKGAR